MQHSNARAILIVLDGFGIGKDSPFNAIKNANMPFYRGLMTKYPHSQILTHGEAVGLPDGIMGNSEVGHMTMGAGRIVYQDLTRISKSVREKEFHRNPEIRKAIEAGAHATGRVHLMGLLSNGGVHSTMEHLLALMDLCAELRVPHVSLHFFLDGRDTPPDSAPNFVREVFQHPGFQGATETGFTVASICGRYYAMDRDKRWDRVRRAYMAMTGQVPPLNTGIPSDIKRVPSLELDAILKVIESSYLAGKSDEFVEPVLINPTGAMKNGDSVLFFNFRADRAREISEAMTEPSFQEFDRGDGFQPSAYLGMTHYDRNLTRMLVAFPPQNLSHIFGEWLEERKLSQFRIAETEKYAHVTFFFNGGREKPFTGEDRVLVPSPKDVPTYDLKPEMSAFAVAAEAAERIRRRTYDFVLMNFANADMVGHTGNYEATVKAMEALDQCLAKVIGSAESSGYHVLLTADHGNAEEMRDHQGRIHTQHTLNPVPAVWVAPGTANGPQKSRLPLRDGGLQDIMPTLCDLMGLPLPAEATGKSLVPTH